MTKDMIKIQKFLVPLHDRMYARSYIRSEKEEKIFFLDSTIGPDLDSTNSIIELRYKNSLNEDFPKNSMEKQIMEEIHVPKMKNVYEFDADNYTISFPENGNGRICNFQNTYNDLVINALYKKARLVEEYSSREMRGMVKSTVKIPIEKKK